METAQAPSAARSRLPWRWLVPVALVPAIVAVAQLGRIHPDEVYQSLEPAYAKAFGYGILAWEWQTGLRNWAVPLVFAWLLKLCAALGVDHPWVYRGVLALPQFGLHLAALAAVYRFAERRLWAEGVGKNREAEPRPPVAPSRSYVRPPAERARWVLLLVGLYAPVLTFAGRTLGESLSVSLLLVAFERLDRTDGRWGAYFLGGLCLGLAVVVRYPSAVMVVAALVWLLAARRLKALWPALAGGLLVAGGLGVLDALTWGKPFHSLLAYLDFNLLSGKAAAQFGQEGPTYYLGRVLAFLPLWCWWGLLWAVFGERPRWSLPSWCATAYLAAISFTAHKEPRFLYPALVLWLVASAPAFSQWLGQRRPDLAASLGAVAMVLSVGPFFLHTELSVQRPDQFQAIVRSTRQDATGLLIINEGVWGAGGYFYVGKNIPWTVCDWVPGREGGCLMALNDRRINRVVTYDEGGLPHLSAAGFQIAERIGRATWLFRTEPKHP